MRLPTQILHDAGDEIEHIAIVMGRRKGNVKYIDPSNGLLSRDLGGIDHWRRLDHIDYLSNLLLVGERDIDIRRAGLDCRQAERIESFLLNRSWYVAAERLENWQ